ncbi:MAG: 30S ribosome-binding factor RbfA, partial [Acidobacteriota bacterium]
RTAQVGVSLRDALVEVFRTEMKDIDIGMVSITEVEISPDLHLARVYISGLDEKATRKAVKELQARKGRLRSAMGQRIHLRVTPELEFKFDETTMRAGRIESILHDIKTQDEQAAPQSEDEEPEHDHSDDDQS